jgi:hypothetical protein
MTPILQTLTGTSEPFALDTGVYDIAVTGEFGVAVLERQVPTHDARVIYDRAMPAFTEPGVGKLVVVPNAIGNYRLRVDPGKTPPALNLVVSEEPQP